MSARIERVHEQSRQICGARRVQAELRPRGETVPRRRVARLMRALGVQGVTRRKPWSTTSRDSRAHVAPDRVQRQFEAGRPGRLWVTEITNGPTGEGFVFLAMVLDVFIRRIVGWAMGSRQTVELAKAALATAGDNQGTPAPVLHSDQGSQCTALSFTRQCLAAGIERSMGTAGDCYDNAMAESFFATLECELLHRVRFATRERAEQERFLFVESFYNRRRRHSGLE